jgi:hypothetical protein
MSPSVAHRKQKPLAGGPSVSKQRGADLRNFAADKERPVGGAQPVTHDRQLDQTHLARRTKVKPEG